MKAVALVLLLVCCAAGCTAEKPTATGSKSIAGLTVKLLVVGDPVFAAAAQGLAEQWHAQTGAKLEVAELTAEQAFNGRTLEADVVVFAAAELGTLVQSEQVAPLEAEQVNDPALAWGGVFDQLRLREAMWGEEVYAVPLGSPVPVLYYRADLLRQVGREPPRTWAEYQELATLLNDRANLGERAPATDARWAAVAEPCGEGWGGLTLLARAAAYAQHRENYSALFSIADFEPLVAGPPFVRALDEMRAARPLALPAEAALDPAATRQAFWRGECAMAITWPSAAARAGEGEGTSDLDVGVAPLPGSDEAYDTGEKTWEKRLEGQSWQVPVLSSSGRLGAISAASVHREAAFTLLAALSRETWAADALRRNEAITLYRRSQLSGAAGWVEAGAPATLAPAYADVIAQCLNAEDVLAAIPIPGHDAYLQALDNGVRAGLASAEGAEFVLQRVAAAWRDVTAKMGGTDRQLRAYQRSLGLRK